ncbi:P-loop containing nucleoside triphosphate hydrolase protein [Xylaria scruposa]|nr:P-loop containing nucleoside triphosphate hydrolase protein [Xylaria scruposa]
MNPAGSETPERKWREETCRGYQNAALDELMNMIGLRDVKNQFLQIWYETKPNQASYNTSNDLLSAVFLGDTGTGKTTIARIYSKFISCMKVFGPLQNWTFKETSGLSLALKGVPEIETLIGQITRTGGGALFIDDAHQLVKAQRSGDTSALDRVVASMKDPNEKVVFVFAGHQSGMETIYEHNTSLRGHIRYTFKLQGYDESEILQMLCAQIKRISSHMQVSIYQQRPQDPAFLLRVVARRIIRADGVEGFGNAWAVGSTVAKIKSRFLRRLSKGCDSTCSDPYLLTEDDILGPGHVGKFESKSLDKLEGMIGLKEVKDAVRSMVKEVLLNRTRELKGDPLLQTSLNKVFLGNPGTGKTTVAGLYGQILVELGMLSNGEVVLKTPADFISGYVGGSESITKAILESSKGKVLIIDEAYGLGNKQGAKGTSGVTDSYRSGIIDTIVGTVNGQAGEDRCILLLGYKDKMEEMYQDVNPGFKRRFPLNTAFVFKDYTTDQLRQIWKKKLRFRGLLATKEAEDIAMEILERQRHKLNFGNAGEVDIILDEAQRRYLERLRDDSPHFDQPIYLQPADIDPEYQRLANAAIDVEKLFKGVVGCDEVKKEVRKWPKQIAKAKEKNLPNHKVFDMSFAFTGPPGTGKTTTAKNMGTILYSLGLLASNEVNVISATELTGEYIGQTGPKVRRQFEASLGKILFIDEAYRLDNGAYGKDAIDEVVTLLTEDKFKNHLVVIFAGYEKHIRRLLNQNPGLASRVPGRLHFPPFTAEAAMELLSLQLNEDGFRATCLKNNRSSKVAEAMRSLVSLDNWANGRSIENLSREIKRDALIEDQTGPVTYIHESAILDKMKAMRQTLIDQLCESNDDSPYRSISISPRAAVDKMTNSEPKTQTIEQTSMPDHKLKRKLSETLVNQSPTKTQKKRRYLDNAPSEASSRDFGLSMPPIPGVMETGKKCGLVSSRPIQTDANQLAEESEQEQRKIREEKERKIQEEEQRKIQEEERHKKELKERERQERVKQFYERVRKRRAREEEDYRRKKAQAERQMMASLCPAGYDWQHVGGNEYRCAGGSHTIHFPG